MFTAIDLITNYLFAEGGFCGTIFENNEVQVCGNLFAHAATQP